MWESSKICRDDIQLGEGVGDPMHFLKRIDWKDKKMGPSVH